MKFRVYEKENIKKPMLFATYFKTKKDAVLFAESVCKNAVIEKKIGGSWFRV